MVSTGARGGSVTLDGETCRDMTCPPILEVGPRAAPVEDNSMFTDPDKIDKVIRATFAVLVFAAYWYGWFLPSVVKAAAP
jgi:hypothetical protein